MGTAPRLNLGSREVILYNRHMRRIVLIDGENLVYALRHLLGSGKNKAPRSLVSNYNFRGLFDELLSDKAPQNIYWFGARLRLYDATEDLKLKTESAIKSQSHFVNLLQQQKIQFIKVGYLRARESEPCPNCGHNEYYLVEKGVDVGLAVRLLNEAKNNTEIVVVSADTDLLPALQAAKKSGASLMHVGYEHRPINSLSRVADATRLITVPLAKKYLHREV